MLKEHIHPEGLMCLWCQSAVERAIVFRVTRKSELKVYRCKDCKSLYNLYTGTVFEQWQLRPQQAILLIRGVLKGEPSDVLARELELNYVTELQLRRKLQDNAKLLQSEESVPVPAEPTNGAGGTYENDRPPVLCVIGRESGQVRLHVAMDTQAATLEEHVHSFTRPDCHVYMDVV